MKYETAEHVQEVLGLLDVTSVHKIIRRGRIKAKRTGERGYFTGFCPECVETYRIKTNHWKECQFNKNNS